MHYGNGFTHTDVYTMPVYLRRFYTNELIDAKKAEEEAIKKNSKRINPNQPSSFKNPRKTH